MPNHRIPIEERLQKWIEPEPMSGCWLWSGMVNRGGYGCTKAFDGGKWRRKSVHRVSWELRFGPIPDGLYCCHKCDNRACVNPDHLFLSDNLGNSIDRELKMRGRKSATGMPFGVVRCGNGFRVQVRYPGVPRLPKFATLEEAVIAAEEQGVAKDNYLRGRIRIFDPKIAKEAA